MIYVMVLIVRSLTGNDVHIQEFDGKDKCEAAIVEVKKSLPRARASCVPK